MKTVAGQCDLCNWRTNTPDPAAMVRALGYHKSVAHGIKGKYNDPEYVRRMARERYFRIVKGYSPAEVQKRMDKYDAAHPKEDARVQHRREYQKQYRATHPKNKAQQNGSDAVAAKLSECPCCGARFFVVKGAA